MKEKIGFLIFHILFAACQIAMPILGLKLISIVFYLVGAAVVLFGIISFLPGVKFWTVFLKDGSNYEANNIGSCLITLVVTVLLGGVITALPQYLNGLGLFIPIFTYLISIFIGLKIIAENNSWYYVSDSIRWIGKLVPCVYILVILITILPLLNPTIVISPVVQIVLMSVAGAFHLFRTVLVTVSDPF